MLDGIERAECLDQQLKDRSVFIFLLDQTVDWAAKGIRINSVCPGRAMRCTMVARRTP